MESISERLDIARKELLDLSLKNPLINYRLRVSSGIEFPYLNAADVFNYLVNEGKKSFFTTEKSNNPSKLYAPLNDKELHRKLLRTYRSSRMYIEEKGANILFLALGFLKWRADDEDENFYRAPLIMVPVEFKKVDNLDKFYLQYSGDEVRLNISLITKLNNDFGINIDYEYEGEIESINEYLRRVDEIISTSSKTGWQVESGCGAFDFFSFAKFLMYKDLDLSTWQNSNGNVQNPVLEKLFFTGFSDRLGDMKASEDSFCCYNLHNVVDADSSQANVIWQIANGRNMVIQGPPGTGKSQTITNIIASCVAAGKSVLFVSEKKAALDVVKNRLEKVGLGDLVLELHSYKSNKSDVLKSIEHTINLGEPKVSDNDQLKAKYEESKGEIDAYRDAINSFVAKSQATLVEIYGNLLKIRDKADSENFRLPHIEFDDGISEWTDREFEDKLGLVREYMSVLKSIGKIEKHPFYGVELKKCMPYDQVTIKEKICDMEDSLAAFMSVVEDIGSAFSNRATNTIFESGRLINSIDALERFKELGDVSCRDILILQDVKRFEELAKIGREVNAFRKNLGAYAVDPYNDCEEFIRLYDDYNKRRDADKERKERQKAKLTSYLADGKYSRDALSKLYDFLVNVNAIKNGEDKLKSVFPKIYSGMFNTDWSKIRRLLAPAKDFADLVIGYNVLPQTKNLIGDEDALEHLRELKAEFLEKKKDLEDRIAEFMDMTSFNYMKRFGSVEWYLDMSFNELRKTVLLWKSKCDSVIDIVRYNEITDRFVEFGLASLLEYSYSASRTDNLDDIISNEYYESLVNSAYAEFEYLGQFKEYRYERILDNYKSLDVKLMVENIKRILMGHYERMPRISDDNKEMNILRRELQKKKNQLPIRKLFSKTIATVQRIKPVFMMSPISIASFMPPESEQFDLVIFDEASQVRPVEAFGALLRSKQIVVVGDSKQLPPTTFFDTLASKYDDVNDEDYDFANMESVLSLLLARNIPERTLSWHYRSRNQSLIAVSNSEFYNQSLKVFPSVYDRDPNQGLVYRYIPESCYDRGGSRTNRKEASEVIKAVFKHIAENPGMSIGVVSFSLAQQEELYREFDIQRKKHVGDVFERFFDSSSPEPFFIKNLESVQGDERDVIFISIGYGFDSEHKVSMDFGPLNKEGGERRLNVLITRAKYKCFVFTNLTCHDINLTKTTAFGVLALKRYLEYAQNRTIITTKDDSAASGAFVDFVSDKLGEYGYDIDRNIGAKVGIDLAVFDKELDRFTVGIECDGGRRSKDISFATDRERIRPNVLKSLGWKIYHIWAPSFYRNPRFEFSKLLDFIQEAQKETKEESQNGQGVQISRKKGGKLEEVAGFVSYKQYSGPKRRTQVLSNADELSELISKIVQIEAPLHVLALKKILLNLTNLNRMTPEQVEVMEAAIGSSSGFVRNGDFLCIPDAAGVEVRNRSELDKAFRKAEYICDDEYEEYVKRALFVGDAVSRDDLYKCVADYFGVPRNKYSKEAVDRVVDKLAGNGYVYFEKDLICISDEGESE